MIIVVTDATSREKNLNRQTNLFCFAVFTIFVISTIIIIIFMTFFSIIITTHKEEKKQKNKTCIHYRILLSDVCTVQGLLVELPLEHIKKLIG